jgi:hypothetical protein
MMNLLEKAGLVAKVEGGDSAAIDASADAQGASSSGQAGDGEPSLAAVAAETAAPGVSLQQIYESAGVPACPFPAERLLKLLDGLRAMDEPIRLQTIRALDAADDSWNIADPVSDADAKVKAIQGHVQALKAGVDKSAGEGRALVADLRERHDKAAGAIRQQMAELDALLQRAVAKHAEECASVEAAQAAREQGANRDVEQLARVAGELQSVVTQFGVNKVN